MLSPITKRGLLWQQANRPNAVHIAFPFSGKTYCGKDQDQVTLAWTIDQATCPICKLRQRTDKRDVPTARRVAA